MGEVYRGWDDRLGRPVAVKVLHPALAADEHSRQRFLRETRLACRVVHPYVATVFDVLEKEERVYLVMEYIEGRRLQDVIDEDDPTSERVVRIGLEIAEALTAIHVAGLIHRDLKPSNVMVTPAGHVKVMDFGVAYPIKPAGRGPGGDAPSEPTLTREGGGVGTVSYMSPEQIRGGMVDERSDLFALGIVLYETLAREHPFQRGSVLATASAILNEQPGSGSQEPRSLTDSGAVRQIVFRLLEKSPESRYRSAGDVVADLRATLERKPLPVPRARPAWRPWVGAATLVAAAIAFVGGWTLWNRSAPTPPPTRLRVAVIPFEDAGGGDESPGRGAALAGFTGAGLSEAGRLLAIGQERVYDALAPLGTGASRRRSIAALAATARVDYVVAGALHESGSALEAIVEVVAPPSADGETFTVSAASLSALGALVAAGIERTLGVRDDGDRHARGGSPDDAAAIAYERARSAQRELRLADALGLARRAVTLDPRFVEPRTLLVESLVAAGYGREARAAAKELERLLGESRTGTRAAARARAAIARAEGDVQKEVEILEETCRAFPDDAAAALDAGAALLRAGRGDEALGRAQTAAALDDSWAAARMVLCRAQATLGRFDQATATLDEAERLLRKAPTGSGLGQVAWHRGWIATLEGKSESAVTAYLRAAEEFRAAGLEGKAAEADRNAADAEALLGRLVAAESRTRAAVDTARRLGYRRLAIDALAGLGARQYVGGEYSRAEATLRDALAEAREVDNDSAVLPIVLNLGSLLRRTGRTSAARPLVAEGLDIARASGNRRAEAVAAVLLADLDLLEGRLPSALDGYRTVVAMAKAGNVPLAHVLGAFYELAEAAEAVGAWAEGLAAADEAVAGAREAKQTPDLAYALLRRARLRTRLLLLADAEADLAELERLARDPTQHLEAHLPRAALARGDIAAAKRRWSDAERQYDVARRAGNRTKETGLETPALIGAARAASARGDAERARVLAEKALGVKATMPHEAIEARLALCRAFRSLGRPAEASTEARRSLDEAAALGSPWLLARSAAEVASAVGMPAAEPYLRQGRDALQEFLAALPPERRDAVRRGTEMKEAVSALAP
jgi:tetratricopeptide (TPR) repeat protein